MSKKFYQFFFQLLAVDFLLLNIAFFAMNYWKRGTLALSPIYKKLLVITDLVILDIDGMNVLENVKKLDEHAVVMVIKGYGNIESAVEAIKKGAYDYISKPLKFKEIELIINRALDKYTIFNQMRIFRGMFLFLLFSIPVWIVLGALLISIL